jgi:hypothetical protein
LVRMEVRHAPPMKTYSHLVCEQTCKHMCGLQPLLDCDEAGHTAPPCFG